MTWGVINAAMLLGLLGAAVPVVIHFINRARDPIVDWGAMQFLELGRRARQRLRLNELLLMLARMSLLAIVAVALARPFQKGGATAGTGGGPARDIVIVLDGSSAMERRLGETTPKLMALNWVRAFVPTLGPGDSVALLVASDRVRSKIDPPTFDKSRVLAALDSLEQTPARGSSDIPSALASAFRILERTQNPARDVVILTEGLRSPWRPGEPARWALLKDLHKRLPIPPHLWSVAFDAKTAATRVDDVPNGSVGPLSVSRALVTPEMPITVSADLLNSGPGPLTRTAELVVEGHAVPGSSRVVGPIPAEGRSALEFKTSLKEVGSHLVTIRLVGDDDVLPGDDESSIAVEVAPALGVLLVDGEPSNEPLASETDFLRAALAPRGDETPRARASVVSLQEFSAKSLRGQSVVVLANCERLSMDQASAVESFLIDGGGVLIAPGDRTDAPAWNARSWLPAKLNDRTGDFTAKKSVAHPAPASFSGAVLAPFGKGESPALRETDLFAYWRLEPVPGASVSARLDTGEPWAVERPQGKGRVLLLAGPLDAEGGTLPVNPDFVPLVHEWAFSLASGREARAVKPGEPLVFDLNPVPSADVRTLPIVTPSGDELSAIVTRTSGLARARFDDTVESGVYRLTLPDPPGGILYATVASDPRGADLSPLDPAEATKLAEGWPLIFESDPAKLPARILTAGGPGGRRELWRWLVGAALVGLCIEIYLTRRLVRRQGH
jgi:hypothetical protein